MTITVAWVGDGAARMEVAHVEQHERELTAIGTQLGASYELRYRLEAELLRVELVGRRSLDVPLDGADFLRDHLLEPGPAHDYVMRWIDVPSLRVSEPEQRYEPLGDLRVRFRSEGFTADIQFDESGFVVEYPGIARRA